MKKKVQTKRKQKLRVWWIPQVPGEPFYASVCSPKEGKKIMNILADYDRFQFDNKIKPDYANTGGLEVFEDEEWTEWYCNCGEDIDDCKCDTPHGQN